MSVNYTSYFVVGLKIDLNQYEKYLKSTTIRGCEHTIKQTDDYPPKFCSECGKPFFIAPDFCKGNFEHQIQKLVDEETDNDLTPEYKVIGSTDLNELFVGLVTETDKIEKILMYDIESYKMVKSQLTQMFAGLISLTENNFGFWVVQKCSY